MISWNLIITIKEIAGLIIGIYIKKLTTLYVTKIIWQTNLLATDLPGTKCRHPLIHYKLVEMMENIQYVKPLH